MIFIYFFSLEFIFVEGLKMLKLDIFFLNKKLLNLTYLAFKKTFKS